MTYLVSSGLKRGDNTVFKIDVLKAEVAIVIDPLLVSPIATNGPVHLCWRSPSGSHLARGHSTCHFPSGGRVEYSLLISCERSWTFDLQFLRFLVRRAWSLLKGGLPIRANTFERLGIYGTCKPHHKQSKNCLHSEPRYKLRGNDNDHLEVCQ